MVTNLIIVKKKYAEYENKVRNIREDLVELKKFIQAVDQDTEAVNEISQGFNMPKETEEEKKHGMKPIKNQLY